MADRLYLLNADWFDDQGGPWFCPPGARIEGVLGLYPRNLCYFPATGKAFVKRLEQVHSEKLLPQDKEKPSNAARLVQTTLGGSVDLF